MVIILLEKTFQKWGLDFIGPIKLASKLSRNQYILIATNYATKWVEARMFCSNVAKVTTKKWYEYILAQFQCPLTIVIDQGTYFINNVIKYLTNHFILRHPNFIVYYPQGNGQVEFTNKVFGTLLTKLVHENWND